MGNESKYHVDSSARRRAGRVWNMFRNSFRSFILSFKNKIIGRANAVQGENFAAKNKRKLNDVHSRVICPDGVGLPRRFFGFLLLDNNSPRLPGKWRLRDA